MNPSMRAVMAQGAACRADVLDALAGAGLPGYFAQTERMNFALEVTLETVRILLITEADDDLAWERGDHRGWGGGLYPRPDEADDGALVFATVDAPSLAALLGLVEQVLGTAPGASEMTAR